MRREESNGVRTKMKIVVLYVGSSLLAPLRQAEREINAEYSFDLSLGAYNFGAPLDDTEWRRVDQDLSSADLVFVLHVTDGENAGRLLEALDRYDAQFSAVIVINCMPDLMRRTRMGRLNLARAFRATNGSNDEAEKPVQGTNGSDNRREAKHLLATAVSWMGRQARARGGAKTHKGARYLHLVKYLPSVLNFVPATGKLRDVKHYLYLFSYFLQPTPGNIRSMLLYGIKNYVSGAASPSVKIVCPSPEILPTSAIYHPDASSLFEDYESYRAWYESPRRGAVQLKLFPESTIGLLLLRPQIVSGTTRHYDGLIRAIESEGMAVLPVISNLMDNRESCNRFFIEASPITTKRERVGKKDPSLKTSESVNKTATSGPSRVAQILSLTGFSFVGGPAMNDSVAAASFLLDFNRPFHSAVSLEMQTIQSWQDSGIGLNAIQSGMQVAIPEIDGATEPFVYGGVPVNGLEPEPLAERCRRIARRLKRWNHLRTAARDHIKVAMTVFCFPPNKGNIGTAADLDVFESLIGILRALKSDGYSVEIPRNSDELRQLLLRGNSEKCGSTANVAYKMGVDEYIRLCPYAEEVAKEWGPPPGNINSFGRDLLIEGIQLGNVFLGVQPSFGYEGDPMRLLMARSGCPHHGFMALYTYLEKVFGADVVVHVGTHGALEFMPGKQVGLSEKCWPDRLIGEMPNIYIYSVNNPSEGSIAKRRSYAELISYLTPPIESAGLYRNLAGLKDLLLAYRQSTIEEERQQLFAAIESSALELNFKPPEIPRHESRA